MTRFGAESVSASGTCYTTEIVGLAAGPIETSAGFELLAAYGLNSLPEDTDTLLVAGGDGHVAVCADHDMLSLLCRAAPRVRRIGSICTGAFILAAAGLLDGKRATTHWRYCDELNARYPSIAIEPDALHVRDGKFYTSAGVTAGMDLALALVEDDCGRDTALATAREMVTFLKRPGGQSQFCSALEPPDDGTTPLGRVRAWILNNLNADLSVENLAERAAMSPRNFARVFVRETGKTPAKFIERARVDAARQALEDGAETIDVLARRFGFGHAETMRRVFLRHVSVGPQDYRRRFQAQTTQRTAVQTPVDRNASSCG
jgi:transcriptional regulator GlxA family with amidase domain